MENTNIDNVMETAIENLPEITPAPKKSSFGKVAKIGGIAAAVIAAGAFIYRKIRKPSEHAVDPEIYEGDIDKPLDPIDEDDDK